MTTFGVVVNPHAGKNRRERERVQRFSAAVGSDGIVRETDSLQELEALAHEFHDEGIDVLNAFVDANPSLPNRGPARMLLSQGYRAVAERELSKRNAPAAEKAARTSLAFDASNADAHNLLGAALASQGNLRAAIPEFQAAVRINPKHEVALKNLAQAIAMSR